MLLALFLSGRRSQARELALLIPNLVVLFRGLLADPRVPKRAKWLLGFATLWIVSPIDLVPEFLPLIGPIDDAIVAALALRYLLRHTDRSVVDECWRGDPRTLDVMAGPRRRSLPD